MANLQRFEDTFDYAFDSNGNGGFNSNEDLEVIVGKVVKSIAPNMQESFQDIPARYGGVYMGTDYQEKQIDIPIVAQCESTQDYEIKIQNLSNILVNASRDKDVQYPLRFNSNPDIVYYGHFTSIPQPSFLNEGTWDFQLTLTFMLADPRGFLPQEQIKLLSNQQTIVPNGNTEVKPVIHILPKEDLYYFGYDQDEHYVAVGYNVNQGITYTQSDGSVVDPNVHQTLQVDDPCSSLSTWFVANSNTQNVDIYNGEEDGTAVSTSTAITVGKDDKGYLNFGKKNTHTKMKGKTEINKWYGPVLLHNGLPQVTPYWKVQLRFHHVKRDKRNRAMGRVEGYLLDSEGRVKARMGIADLAHGKYPVAYIQLGSSFNKQNDKGKYKTLIWTTGPANQKTDGGRNQYNIKYTKTVQVKVTPKKKKSTRSLDGLQTRKRQYVHHKMTRKTRNDTGGTHKYRKRRVSVTKARKGGKVINVSKPKTKSVKKTETLTRYGYQQRDVFSDFFGSFTLERCKASNGKDMWKAGITRLSTDSVTPDLPESKKVDIKTTFVDQESKYGFALSNVAIDMQKMDIGEDKIEQPYIYKNDFLSVTDYKVWKTDGVTDPDSVPHIIAHAGQEIIIDNTEEKVYVEGNSVDKYVSWGSDFPPLYGGTTQELNFSPSAENADIYLDYRPAIK